MLVLTPAPRATHKILFERVQFSMFLQLQSFWGTSQTPTRVGPPRFKNAALLLMPAAASDNLELQLHAAVAYSRVIHLVTLAFRRRI